MVTFTFGAKKWMADLQTPIDISIPVSPSGVTAWGLDRAGISPHREGDFIGAVAAGSPVNFNDIVFNPHAHGTHTESVGHLLKTTDPVHEVPPPPWMLARLITVEVAGGKGIPPETIREGIQQGATPALVIRTSSRPQHPNAHSWTDSAPPFLLPETAGMIADSGVQHLLIDLPSVDPEKDGGALKAHKAFWGLPDNPRKEATITELVDVSQEFPDGVYLLNLQVAAFINDASPSRPLLFRVREV